MQFYRIPAGDLPRLTLWGKEHLTGGRLHVTRRLNETVIYCMTEGQLEMESGGEHLLLKPGDIHIFNRGEFQCPVKADECQYYYIHLMDTFPMEELDETQARDYFVASRQNFLHTNLYNQNFPNREFACFMLPKHCNLKNSPYQKAIKECLADGRVSYRGDKKDHYDVLLNMRAVSLFYYLHHTCSASLLNASSGIHEDAVYKLMEYIQDHLGQPIEGETLATRFGYSFDHINRNFKRITGETVFSYIKKSRINYAKQLLYTKSISVGSVAERTGYCDIYHFSKDFKKQTGLTPTEYIKLSRG